MKLRTLATTAALALAIGIIPFTAISQPEGAGQGRPGGHGPHEGRPPFGGGPEHQLMKDLIPFWENEELATELGLDEGQILLLDESLTNAKETLDGEKESLKTAMDAVRDAMEVDNPDLDAVYAAMDEVAVHKTTIAKAAAGHRVAVKNILTAEQEETLKEKRRELIKERVRERVGDRFPGLGGGFDGPEGEGRPLPPLDENGDPLPPPPPHDEEGRPLPPPPGLRGQGELPREVGPRKGVGGERGELEGRRPRRERKPEVTPEPTPAETN